MILARQPMLVERQHDGSASCTPLRVVPITNRDYAVARDHDGNVVGLLHLPTRRVVPGEAGAC